MAKSGLYRTDSKDNKETLIPLQSSVVLVKLIDYCGKVTIVQRYANEEDCPIEARYLFPLDEAAAVCEFEVVIDDKKLVGIVKENQEAKEIYDDAIAAGKGAYMLEEVSEDVFQVYTPSE